MFNTTNRVIPGCGRGFFGNRVHAGGYRPNVFNNRAIPGSDRGFFGGHRFSPPTLHHYPSIWNLRPAVAAPVVVNRYGGDPWYSSRAIYGDPIDCCDCDTGGLAASVAACGLGTLCCAAWLAAL